MNGLFDVDRLHQQSAVEIVELDSVDILVVACQEEVALEIETVAGDGGAADLAHSPSRGTYIPNLHHGVPPSTEEDVGILQKALDRKYAIDMMIDFQFLWPSSLKCLAQFHCLVIEYLDCVAVCSEDAPVLLTLIVTAKVRYVVSLAVPVGCLLVAVVPLYSTVTVTSHEVLSASGFPTHASCWVAAQARGVSNF
jgi:hypothetical protein